jgi:cytoskeletal protein RodZ
VESLGIKLKSARESKGYQFDQISREINIAERYLEALEQEDFAGFPGEAYILGFLRNYGEYLGLDPQELIFLYRSLKVQEQPVPVDQLLKAPPVFPGTLFRFFIALVILGVLGGGAYFALNYASPAKKTAAVEPRSAAEYFLGEEPLERRFYVGDSVFVSSVEGQYKVELSNLGETVTFSTPGGTVILDLGQEVNIDLNGDGMGELRIAIADFVKNDPSAGALLHFELSSALPVFEEAPPSMDNGALAAAGRSPETPAAGTTASANGTVIFIAPNAYPFTVQAAFQGYCMFRWEILFERDRQIRNEQYFQRNAELSIQAQNGVRLWASNAAAAKLQVIGGGRTAPLDLGGAGEVVVADIRWVRDEDNRYRLVLMRLE